ncbi:412_t:CDS:1 [Gigaspora margarita]|uniref:412_t:CDS:1 n=1 Tax=Gigaspora margarita TaxID=4874 RepID=A0ABN7VJU2_GIGMA|nr:412_t:CDS:1 [Gigaspora margarita]
MNAHIDNRQSEIDINGNKYKVISEEPEETNNSYSDDEALDNQDIDIQVLQNIKNPNHVIGRGRPSKRHYKSSIETKQKRQETSSRGSYKCGQCGKVGHNAAYHKPKGKGRGK